MRKNIVKRIFTIFSVVVVTSASSPATTLAVAPDFLNNNDIIYYDPNLCNTGQSGAGVPGEGGHVYNGSAPDPAVVLGEDGVYHLYATGEVHLTSSDMTSWEKQSNGWNLQGAPNDAGGAKWAPDVAKIGSKYVLTYTIPTGTPEIPGGGPPKIAYATSNSAGGPFVYRGKLSGLSYSYNIDSHIFVDDDGKPWLFWGGGEIHAVELKLDGDRLTTTGPQKELLTKGGVGSDATIEGSWVVKRNGWYYLTYSQGHYRRSDGPPEYRVLVARSKNVMGPYQPDNSMKPLLEASGDVHYPGHHSIITDGNGQDWIVYHGYFKNDMETRSLFISKLGYDSNWPVLGGSSASATAPTGGTGAPEGQVKVSQANIKVDSPNSEFNQQLNRIIERNPDFISGNEWSSRSNDDIKRPGYDFYRGENGGDPSRHAEGDVVMWKSDKWTKVDSGTVKITLPADKTYHSTVDAAENWDGKRSMAWVTLQDASGNKVSMASIHHIVNPAKYAPRPERKALYKLGMERAVEQLKKLQGIGPVILAGDFNAQTYRQPDNTEPWHPKQMLGGIDMEATAYSLAKPGPVNVAVDYIFYTKKDIKAISHTSPFMLTDHPYLEAVLEFQGNATYNGTSSNNCVCSEGGESSATLTGSDNEEKAFNFFIAKGLTPQQAAGIVGNMKAESGVLPMRLQSTPAEKQTSSKDAESSSSGWGLVQWTPAGKMIRPSKQAGKSYEEIDTLAFQLQFLWEQLTGEGLGGTKLSEKAAGDHLKQQTTIDGAARSFMLKFERPADQSESAQAHRVQLANDVFGRYGTGSGGGSGTSTSALTAPAGGCGEQASGGGSVVSIAQAELAKGVKEDPLGCDSGNPSVKGSCGPEVDKYTDSYLQYWCADFVSWVYKQAGTPFTGGSSGGWRIAAVDSLASWFKQNGTYIENGPGVIPQPGDVYFLGSSSDLYHTGIVEKVEGNTIYTISGNTSIDNTSNGYGVGDGQYQVGSAGIHSFGRLK